jgi:cytochrome c oxidase subunit I
VSTADALLPGAAGTSARTEAVAIGREATAELVLRTLLASTAIFLVAGLLGGALRQSQAGIDRFSPSTWYAIMTAHGLAAFVGWAGFALMGASWWVLEESGFPLRRSGAVLAEITYWSMVIGVAGVVVTTLAMGFGGSWVFLYPLPFDSAGQWTELATGLFAASVLCVGVSILAWCASILVTVLSPASHGRGGSLGARLGATLGFGYVSPRFATTRQPVPFALIPLTVIAIDMIIATIPFAALLVEMIVQAIDPSVGIDPLLAKGVLWWFGHPVVYLLLFPAVALLYHLVPKYAGRPLVAGRLIVAAWLIAVVVNVIIGAHHMYLDFPSGSAQPVISTMMQPLTFAIVTPSALSLYSLCATIWGTKLKWTIPMQFLFVAMCSWLIAGLQGLINATIVLDLVVHNTLWIVGHFHNMALLNIGLVILAAMYAFIPDLIGRPWYSERLARWHLVLTTVGGYGSVIPWLIQGLDGAPRRWAVLPDRYATLTDIALPFVALLFVGQAIFAYNLLRTLGKPFFVGLGTDSRSRRREELGALIAAPAPAFGIWAAIAAPFAVGPIAVVLALGGYRLGARRAGLFGLAVAALGMIIGVLQSA